MQGDIVAQGIELMLYGMGTVVLFLALLVLATTAMSNLITRFFHQPEPAAAGVRASDTDKPAEVGAALDPGLVAAITAALHLHRAKRK
jgi:oxaloacetate decarboxylase gamma subunit